MALGKGFFALFPEGKSAGQGPHSGVGTGCGLYSMDAGGLWCAHGALGGVGGPRHMGG